MNNSLPHNPDAERAVLGSILIDPQAFGIVSGQLTAQSFYLAEHNWIWHACESLTARGVALDAVTVCDELDRAGQLAESGGMAYLARLINSTATSVNAESYARLVAEEYQRRRMLGAAAILASKAYTGTPADMAEVAADAMTIAESGAPARLVPARDVAGLVWEELSDREKAAARAVPTGIVPWDLTLGWGLERGTLTTLMARPGMGKTALMVQVSDAASERGLRVAVFSKEMTARQWLLRMACRRARVSALSIKQGRASADAEQRVRDEVIKLSERDTLLIDDSTPQSTGDVMSACRRLADTAGLDLVIADHLRLFADTADNETKRLGNISWALKQIAKRLDVAVLAAAQLNRGVEGQSERRPDLKDLRDSGEIEENSDNVTAIYRDSYYSNNPLDKTAELLNRKVRDGERNSCANLIFLPEWMSFERKALS